MASKQKTAETRKIMETIAVMLIVIALYAIIVFKGWL